MQKPNIQSLSKETKNPKVSSSRKVYFGTVGGHVKTKVYDRYGLQPGFKGIGPAILEEYGSTTVVWPGDSFEIGSLLEIRINCQKMQRKRNA